jgi:hypothetical protein
VSRFFERYGLLILWVVTCVAGVALLYSAAAFCAYRGMFPSAVNIPIVVFNEILTASLEKLIFFVDKHLKWVGALATLGTFVVGLVTGVRQAHRQLPHRLAQFMQEQLTPVFDNTEALVAAVTRRSAHLAQNDPLYLKGGLDRALDALGGKAPRRKKSLDESIEEAQTHIETTEKRLVYLKDIRSHAQILRGAVESYNSLVRASDEKTVAEVKGSVEDDFTSAIGNETTKMAALELRGLLRARCLGNLKGALQDFIDLQRQAREVFCTRGHARALRLQSEILFRQSAGENPRLLLTARRNLNRADKLFEDGRTLDDADWMERAQNREACGDVQGALSAMAGATDERANRAFKDALRYYQLSKLSSEADLNRIRERMGTPSVAVREPNLVCRLLFRLCGSLQTP